jgi:hypothetical protein
MRRWLLPDASTGHYPGTLARKLSRCKPACLRSQTGRVWRTFCRHGTNFIEHYACRDTSLIGADKLSRYRILIVGTGAVSRYKVDRSQKNCQGIMDFNCVQMRVSGCKFQQDLSWVQYPAKTVTSPLIIPSVLCLGIY